MKDSGVGTREQESLLQDIRQGTAPCRPGGLAQLARASALQAEGQRFESVILHIKEIFDMLDIKSR